MEINDQLEPNDNKLLNCFHDGWCSKRGSSTSGYRNGYRNSDPKLEKAPSCHNQYFWIILLQHCNRHILCAAASCVNSKHKLGAFGTVICVLTTLSSV
jgi:hypothetical protein